MNLFKSTLIHKTFYILVIMALLFINFTRKKTDIHNVNGLEVIETYSIKMPLIPKRIKSLILNHRGISFKISYNKPITITSDDGITRKSHLKEIGIIDRSLQINLKNSVTLLFRVDNEGDRLTVSSNIPKVFPSIKEVSIPFEITRGYNLEETDLSYKIYNSDDEFHLKLNDNYSINSSNDYIQLFAENDKVSTLTFSPLNAKQLKIAEQWYMKYRDPEIVPIEISMENYLGKVDKMINKKYDSISYFPETNTWDNLPSDSKFTEDEAIIYLANAMKSNDFPSRLNKIKGLKAMYPSKFGFRSTPYLGNLIKHGSKGIKTDLVQLKDIQKLVNKSDSKILRTEIPDHYFADESINAELLEEIINTKDKKDLRLIELTSTLNNILILMENGLSNSNSSDSIKELTDLIINKIKWDDTGLYLVDRNGKSSQILNLKTGLLLIKASQHETSEYSKPIGEALIDTFFANSDKYGYISNNYIIETKSFSSGLIKPEEIYNLVSSSSHLPHYHIEEGIKIWTISNDIKITKTANETIIEIDFPVNSNAGINSHHLVISGLTPYKQLYYRGQQWRADKDFEKWGVGYYYDLADQILYFLPKHKRSKEKIVVTY